MSLLQTINLAHLPEDLAIHIALYENVKNAAFLQQQLLQGNTAFEYAFIDASVHLADSVEGYPVAFTDFEITKFTDIGKVRKVYKLADPAKDTGRGKSKGRKVKHGQDAVVDLSNGDMPCDEAERRGLEVMVLGLMALRGAT
ncbi:MAG: hypothetical protein Q9172_005038 [Xanthocarpia lactea]